jgi:hypothetical protein
MNEEFWFIDLRNVSNDGSSSNFFTGLSAAERVPLGRRRPRFSSSIFNFQRARRPSPVSRNKADKKPTIPKPPLGPFRRPGGRFGRVGGGADLATPLLPVNAFFKLF